MHIESEHYNFLMYTLNAGQPVPSLYIYPVLPCWVITSGVQELSFWSSPLSVNTPTGEPSATVLACTRNPRNSSPPDPHRVTRGEHFKLNYPSVCVCARRAFSRELLSRDIVEFSSVSLIKVKERQLERVCAQVL